MVIKEVVEAIKLALDNMDKNTCRLSQIDYNKKKIRKPIIEDKSKNKHLERPFAYEFYQQFRKLMQNGDVDFDGPIIQAEVDKTYQHYFKKGKSPDFIIHSPDSDNNLAVIEFKLATRSKNDIKEDLKKLVLFKTHTRLKYSNGIEVILGTKRFLEKRKKDINNWNGKGGEEIIIVEFDTVSWKADHSVILFMGKKIKFSKSTN